MKWEVYIILCSDNTLYTGITIDLSRRYLQHAQRRGAKYFRARQPLKVVFQEGGHTRSSAGKREAEIKSLPRDAKLALIASAGNKDEIGDDSPGRGTTLQVFAS